MKKIMIVVFVLFVSGCSKTSREYDEFVSKYGAETRVFCDDGFLMRETFLSKDAKAPQLYLINSQECRGR
jgi:hypothetical protein